MKITLELLTPLFFAMVCNAVIGQSLRTEDQNLKGWTKDTKIVCADFRRKPDEKIKKLNKGGAPGIRAGRLKINP